VKRTENRCDSRGADEDGAEQARFEAEYRVALPALPPKGQLDLSVVRRSPYFFS
jgi:DNA-directed RNA polymerase